MLSARDIGGRHLVRPAQAPRPWWSKFHLKHTLTCLGILAVIVGIALSAAWSQSVSKSQLSVLFTPQGRFNAPLSHEILQTLDFPHVYSRVKPLGLEEYSWWESLLARIEARDSHLVSGSVYLPEVISFGEEFGDRFVTGHGTKSEGFTRCSVTAYAIAVYFCGAHPARMMWVVKEKSGVNGLAHSINTAKGLGPPFPQTIWHVNINDSNNPDFGHVFALRLRPDGLMDLYQSYIDEYSLRTHLEGGSGTPAVLDVRALANFLSQLQILENAANAPMSMAASSAYYASFGVKLSMTEPQSETPRILGNISISFTIPCVVPPWNAEEGMADVHAPEHAAAVEALVHPLLQSTSLLDADFEEVAEAELAMLLMRANGDDSSEDDRESAIERVQGDIDFEDTE